MPSLAYMLMTEYHDASKEASSFERKFVFEAAEAMVNNTHHGRSAEEWMDDTKLAFRHILEDSRITLDQEERVAYEDSITMLDDFANRNNIVIPTV